MYSDINCIGGNTSNVAPFGAIQYWDEDDNMWFQNINSLRDSYPNGITLQVQELQIIELSNTGACGNCILLLGGADRGGNGALTTVWQYIFGILPTNDSISMVDGIPNPSVNGATVINPLNSNIFGPLGVATIQDGNSDFSYSFGCIAGVSDGSPCNATTDGPTQLPSTAPTFIPTLTPSVSESPGNNTTSAPTSTPSFDPTTLPTRAPTNTPTIPPSQSSSMMSTLSVDTSDKTAMFLNLPIYILYIIMGALSICLIVVAVLLCYFFGMKRQIKDTHMLEQTTNHTQTSGGSTFNHESNYIEQNDELIAQHFQKNQFDIKHITLGNIKLKDIETKKDIIKSNIQAKNDDIIAKELLNNHNEIQYINEGRVSIKSNIQIRNDYIIAQELQNNHNDILNVTEGHIPIESFVKHE